MGAIICCNPQSTFLMFQDFMPIYLNIELNGAWDLETVSTCGNPGWQSISYLCSYTVARFISLLTFFRCRSLHCTNCVATRNLAVGYVEISVLGKIRYVGLEYDRILRGGSKVPHRWFIDPTHVGPMSKKKYFSHETFSQFLKLNPTDFLYVDRWTSGCYTC